MKQVMQNLKNGDTQLVDIPCPRVKPGHVLIRTRVSLVSAGTERMLVEFGKASLFQKARRQPDRVLAVLDKIRTDGLLPTIQAVRNRLDTLLPLGYCNVGVVMEVGAGVSGFVAGDRVVSNGPHAEVVCVPKNLCARIPDDVSDEDAAFTVIGAIALQGMRLGSPTLGETFVVTGLGLIGLMSVQLLRAQGCRVLGIDMDREKLALAKQFGAETVDLSTGQDPVAAATAFSRGRGVDGVLITASTSSNEPVHQAAQMCRKRGRIVLVGVTGLALSRADFYEKELTFQVSCSYGPGRYDPAYEEKGHDYPFGFVRWTEQRNFEAVLDMLAARRVDAARLISHRFRLDEVAQTYALITSGAPSLGILLGYPAADEKTEQALRATSIKLNVTPSGAPVVVGFIGSGNYASAVLIPAFRQAGVRLKTVASSGGVSSAHAGKKFGFEEATTATEALLHDGKINTVVIATRHNSHAPLIREALAAGKNVFVEKPLAIDRTGLDEIKSAYALATMPRLMVGFNRRFAPQIQKMQALLSTVREPKVFLMTVNAGQIPPDHWTQDPAVGGGRIIGEGCHFIDLLRFLANAPIAGIQAAMIGRASGIAVPQDKASFTMSFADGSLGTVHYLSNGHKSFPKERLEVFCAGRILQLDNYRCLTGYGWPGFSRWRLWRQNKGNAACVQAFVSAVTAGGPSPIPFDELVEVTEASFRVADLIEQ